MTKIGTILDGKYEILKKIGQGGMSVVYLAIDNRLNKQWAVKEIIYKNTEEINVFLKGLEIEANILKKVDHPVLPRIVDIIRYQENVYVVMDYIEGRTLTDILKEEGAQPQELVIEWAKQLADALAYLHSLDPPVIYRDMKPSNIMLKPEGNIKLIDFGTAKEFNQENIADTIALGTKGYAAPEQFGDAAGRGIHNTDVRTDIYSLGATLYHLVTGNNPTEPPYEMRPIREWNKQLSKGLEKIIEKCIQPNPENRFQSCAELLYALEYYDELDDAYKRKSIKRIAAFLGAVIMMIGSIALTFIGYQEKEEALIQNYKNVINIANSYAVSGENDRAIDKYRYAIEDIDRSKPDAYIGMLDLYINMDEVEKGLSDICWYIEHSSSHARPDDSIIFEVARTYFDSLHDYKKSLKYFSMLEGNEEAEYYITLSKILGSTNSSLKDSEKALERFEKHNDTLIVSQVKLTNYNSLASIYSIYIDSLQDASDKIIEISQKALNILKNGDYEDSNQYYLKYYNYMVLAYEDKAEKAEQPEKVKEYYQKVIEYCENTIEYVNKEITTDLAIHREKIISMAEAYVQLGEVEKAEKVCEKGEQLFKKEAQKIYETHIQILCKKQEETHSINKNKWDISEIMPVYQKAIEEIPQIKDSDNFKKITEDLKLETKE